MTPTFYTYYEGGDWIDWPKDKHFYRLPWTTLRHKRAVWMGGLKVHSLAFGPVQGGHNTFERWDCVNGMN